MHCCTRQGRKVTQVLNSSADLLRNAFIHQCLSCFGSLTNICRFGPTALGQQAQPPVDCRRDFCKTLASRAQLELHPCF